MNNSKLVQSLIDDIVEDIIDKYDSTDIKNIDYSYVTDDKNVIEINYTLFTEEKPDYEGDMANGQFYTIAFNVIVNSIIVNNELLINEAPNKGTYTTLANKLLGRFEDIIN